MSTSLVFFGAFTVSLGVICILTAGYHHELAQRRRFEAMWRAERARNPLAGLARLAAAVEAQRQAEAEQAVADLRHDLDRWGQA